MDFTLDKHSPLPPHAQIQEKIKLALLLGRLRPGDTLPSIRDVEQEVGISRNIVRKAYLELQTLGVLNLRHGKGVLVQKQLVYGGRDSVHEKCEALSRDILTRLREIGVSPSAFARYLYQQAREQETQSPFVIFVDATKSQAVERASKFRRSGKSTFPDIPSTNWPPCQNRNCGRFVKFLPTTSDSTRCAASSEVIAEVIPLGLTFSEQTVKELGRLPSTCQSGTCTRRSGLSVVELADRALPETRNQTWYQHQRLAIHHDQRPSQVREIGQVRQDHFQQSNLGQHSGRT